MLYCCVACARRAACVAARCRVVRCGVQGGPLDVTIAGMCYTSKHPKRRAHMPMPFFVVAWPSHSQWYGSAAASCCTDTSDTGESTGRDYLFPALKVPRSEGLSHTVTPALSCSTRRPGALRLSQYSVGSSRSLRFRSPRRRRPHSLVTPCAISCPRWLSLWRSQRRIGRNV